MIEPIKNIRQNGKSARGQKELLKHLSGQRLTLKQAINAHCYDCTGFYDDGRVDCLMPHCPLHPYMPYNQNREKRVTTRKLLDVHMANMRAARQ